MNENDAITFDNLPKAVSRLLQDVEVIKNLLLNNPTHTKTDPVQTTEKDILTVSDISRKLGITKGGVYNLTHMRQIPYYKKGGRIYFDAKELDAWIRSDRRKTIKELQDEADLTNMKDTVKKRKSSL
jgi:excisionase family DNA binding protein